MIQKTAEDLLRKLLPFYLSIKTTYLFSTYKERLILLSYMVIILSIPIGAYIFSEYKNASYQPTPPKKVLTSEDKPITKQPEPSPPEKEVKGLSISTDDNEPEPRSSPAVTAIFGPTLSFKIKLEGRTEGKQDTKLFVGIMEGSISPNPSFLLSFSIDMPPTGEFSGLSLAGLQTGRSYTALFKAPSQIATSSAFIAPPIKANLNSGNPILLYSGDLNEDNIVNAQDLSIAQAAFGSKKGDKKWNESVDFNLDGVVNTLDLAIVRKNLNKEGASGVWAATTTSSPTTLGSP